MPTTTAGVGVQQPHRLVGDAEPISSLSNTPFARKMMIQPYRRISELVQNGIIRSIIVRFFHLAVSFAMK